MLHNKRLVTGFYFSKCDASYCNIVKYHISEPGGSRGEKAVDAILVALVFVMGLTGLIIIGMIITLYFYSHDALGLGHSRRIRSLRYPKH